MKKLKISSIFHWLYCSLLLAPCFAVATACLQTAFHGSEISEVPPAFGHVEDGKKDFKEDLWYVIGDASLDMQNTTFVAEKIDIFMCFTGDTNYYAWSMVLSNSYFNFECDAEKFLKVSLEDNYNPSFTSYFDLNFGNPSENLIFAFRLHGILETTAVGNLIWYWSDMPEAYKTYMPKDYSSGVGDVFYSSVKKVCNSPFFNWAEKSFLGNGFRYAGAWFGLPGDSPFYTYACYWCAISILWLIFDVLMYVPLLVHRWLDKGAIE